MKPEVLHEATRWSSRAAGRRAVKLEVLHVADCPNLSPMLQRLGEATGLPITTRLIETDADAKRFGMAGSPTLLIDGADPFTASDDRECGVSCRLYRDEAGRIVGAPSVDQLRGAITAAGRQDATSPPVDVLSQWRRRALPLDPVERAMHWAVLRVFAATGQPPAPGDLESVTAGSGRTAGEVLGALHAVDAIRLAADGQVVVAYPFSASPTRYRVGLGGPGDRVEVYAMCAIDALGMSSMLGCDSVIESVDVTTGRPITVTTSGGRTSWEPEATVAFVGADECGGASADCCCDYLNLFADRDAAQAWADAHPAIPGQILDQNEAEGLARRLFGHLLATS